MSNITQKLGWKRPLPSPKLHKFTAPHGFALPAMMDLEPDCPSVYDQGTLGSCTSNASSALCQFVMKKVGHKWFMPSRLALYYWTRAMESNVNEDTGASIQAAVSVCHKIGVPQDSMWWYNIAKFAVKPNMKVVADANKYKTSMPLSINHFSLNDMQACIVAGFPFTFGFAVYEGFDTGNWPSTTGMMPMPKVGEQMLGGHAVLAIGYDNNKKAFKIRNSWGTNWGQKGHFWMPYNFIMSSDFADDFWTIKGFDTWPK